MSETVTFKANGHTCSGYLAGDDAVRALEAQLRGLGKDAELHIHVGAEHGFFNDARPEVYNAAASSEAFERTTELFHSTL